LQVEFNNRVYTVKIWDQEYLGSLISLDTETELIIDRSHTPDVITIQAYAGSEFTYLIRKQDVNKFFNIHNKSKFILHNAPFDMDVLLLGNGLMYQLYDECRIIDTSVLFRLLHLGTVGHLNTRYSLDYCVKRFLNIDLPKNEEIRCNFAQYKDVPYEEIPFEFIEYAVKDAIATMQLYLRLMPEIQKIDKYGTMLSHDIQVKGDLALSHITKNGIGFDLARKEEWLAEQDRKLHELQERLANYGWVRGVKGVNERFEDILEWLEIKDKLPRTETGAVSSKSADLAKFRHLPFISDYLDFNELEKATSFVRGIEANRVHGRFTTILNTGRVSMSKPNLMQLPRTGDIRSMFLAKPDHELYIIDYSGMENAMLGQVLLSMYGESVLADTINEGKDLHTYYASILFSKKEEDVTKQERQQAKAAVFGIPGGLGIETFKEFSRGYGLKLTDSEAQNMKDKYFEAFPEMRRYLKEATEGMVYTLTGRARANTSYCAVANTPFQGLGSDMAKLALYNLDKNGFKVVNFIHDEVIIEAPKRINRYKEACNIMVEAGSIIAPDMLIEVEGGKSDRWKKM
jgi:DNA polymerase I-like protein with 3'-5' exonuclease and polymerase domains